MPAGKPEVSVVVSTFNRADQLRSLLDGLRAQTLPRERFEVIVADNASSDGTASVLEEERRRGGLQLSTVRRDVNRGPAAARDAGWRAARSELIAFTDDDCVPDAEWLAAGSRAAVRSPGAIVQGRTEPDPREIHRLGPFSRTMRVTELDPALQTCNIFYPRSVLEAVDGFDTEAFTGEPAGEDSDLGWRAIEAGTRVAFAPDCLVYHAVNKLGPIGKLRLAARWTPAMGVYARHPELRRAHFSHGIFWKPTHWRLLEATAAIPLALRRSPAGILIALVLAFPYLRNLHARGRVDGGGMLLAPYYALHDLIEVYAVIRGAIRYRKLML